MCFGFTLNSFTADCYISIYFVDSLLLLSRMTLK